MRGLCVGARRGAAARGRAAAKTSGDEVRQIGDVSQGACPRVDGPARRLPCVNGADVRVRQDVEHHLGRAAQAHAHRRHDERPVDQDRMRQHGVEQLVVGPGSDRRGRARRRACPSRAAPARTVRPAAAISADQALAARRRLQVLDDVRLLAACADHGERVARRAAGGVVVDGDGHSAGLSGAAGERTAAPRSYQPLRAVHDPDDREHHRHFDQHADDRRQRRAGVEAEQADGGGDGQLEEVATRRSAPRARPRNAARPRRG